MATLLDATPKLAVVPAVTRGFAVACPECGAKGSLRVSLDDVSCLACSSCDDEFTTEYVRDMLATWAKVLAWLDSAPPVE